MSVYEFGLAHLTDSYITTNNITVQDLSLRRPEVGVKTPEPPQNPRRNDDSTAHAPNTPEEESCRATVRSSKAPAGRS